MKVSTQHKAMFVGAVIAFGFTYHKKKDLKESLLMGGLVGNAVALAFPVFVAALDTTPKTVDTEYQEVK